MFVYYTHKHTLTHLHNIEDEESSSGQSSYDAGDEEETYRKRKREDSQTLTGDLIADAETLERLAIQAKKIKK
jgi:hypothetical protein